MSIAISRQIKFIEFYFFIRIGCNTFDALNQSPADNPYKDDNCHSYVICGPSKLPEYKVDVEMRTAYHVRRVRWS